MHDRPTRSVVYATNGFAPRPGAAKAKTVSAQVEPVHAVVPGRTRFAVQGLRRSEDLKKFIEHELPHRIDVISVSGNALSGNVLVTYAPELPLKRITAALHEVAKSFNSDLKGPPAAASRKNARAELRSGPEPGPAQFRTREPLSSWHVLRPDEVLKSLNSRVRIGLDSKDAAERLKKYGPNTLSPIERRSKLQIFFDQLKSLPVAVLSASAALSLLTGGLAEAVVIGGVIAANALIGYLTESGAEKSILSLSGTGKQTAKLLRDKKVQQVDADRVVPGDILMLRPGIRIPADARLLDAKELFVDEALLTGESMPAAKSAAALSELNTAVGDRKNMVFRGTAVTGGNGTAVCVATGNQTEIGNIQSLLGEARPPETPMQKQLGDLGQKLVYACGAACLGVFAVGLLRGQGLLSMLKTAVSLAVAAIPEGLPTVATTTLAVNVSEMRKHGVIIRRLGAVEALGSVQVLCLDKTGTVTENRMSVTAAHCGGRTMRVDDCRFYSRGEEADPFETDELLRMLEVAALCSDAEVDNLPDGTFKLHGSSTEGALVALTVGAGVDVNALRGKYRKIRTEYRTERRPFMVTALKAGRRKRLLAMKGSPEKVLSMCEWYLKSGIKHRLTVEDREEITRKNEEFSLRGYRVLGFAYKTVADTGSKTDAKENLIWLGLIAFSDPIRSGVQKTIADIHKAGIRSIMITGDQKGTALAISDELKLNGRNGGANAAPGVSSIHQLAGHNELLENTSVFYRVSPADKLKIVEGLQAAGNVVAMTGDGVNDGPALKAAEVGIAMGNGEADVARSVADVVLENDDLQTLIVAISQGRTIYNNIRKSLHFLLSTNLSEISVMSAAVVIGLPQPLNPVQLLWVNLLTDVFPALALSVEAPEPDVLLRRPRNPDDPIISNNDLKHFSVESAAMTVGTLAAYLYGLRRYGAGARAGSIAFSTLTIAQLLHAYHCRTDHGVLFNEERLFPNPKLHTAVLGSIGLQLAALFIPGLRRLLGTAGLGMLDMAIVGACAIAPFAANELAPGNRRNSVKSAA